METKPATRDAVASPSPVRRGSPSKASRRASTGSAMAASSRRIEFLGVNEDDDDEDDAPADAHHAPRRRVSDSGAHVTFREYVDEVPPRTGRQRSAASRGRAASGDDARTTESSSARSQQSSGTRRRQVVHWTRHEEQFVIEGVKEYGPGRWRQILEAGKAQGIFHHQRTNVDIKDKWKNLVKRASLTAEEEERADNRNWRETVAAREVGKILQDNTVGSDDDEDAEAGRGTTKKRRLSHNSELIEFIVTTDTSTRNGRTVKIVPRDCPTISTLKRVLARKLLGNAPLPSNLQLVSVKTRRLLGDFEAVDECAERDGCDLYLLYDP